MHSRKHPTSDPHAARVILWDCPSGSASEPKILHSLKVSSIPAFDPEAYERGIRETISLENGFAELLVARSIRETLPYIPQEWSPPN